MHNSRGQDAVIGAIEQRIAEWTHLPPDHGEPIQVGDWGGGRLILVFDFVTCRRPGFEPPFFAAAPRRRAPNAETCPPTPTPTPDIE